MQIIAVTDEFNISEDIAEDYFTSDEDEQSAIKRIEMVKNEVVSIQLSV